MKKGKIYLVLLTLSAMMAACQKETQTLTPVSKPNQSIVLSSLSFKVGDRSVELGAVQQTDGSGCGQSHSPASGGCGSGCSELCNNTSGNSLAWNTYNSAAQAFTLIRQDESSDPSLRFGLWGTGNLDAMTFPAQINDARLSLVDFKRTLVPISDDPALGTGAVALESQDAELIVTSKEGDILKGTFKGVVKTKTGFVLTIENGVFQMNLERQ